MKITTFILFILSTLLCLVFCVYMLVGCIFPSFDVKTKEPSNIVYAETIEVKDENVKEIKNPKKMLADIVYDSNSMYLDYNIFDKFFIEQDKTLENEQKEKYFRNLKTLTYNEKYSPSFSLELPAGIDTSFKSYMCYHTITAVNSAQWKFLKSGDFDITTDENGFLMYKNYYIVAMGSYYIKGTIGSTFRIILDSGVMFDCIVGDAKADVDTDSKHMYHPKGETSGEIIEFLTACGMSGKDCNKFEHTMPNEVKQMGNMALFGFEGSIVSIQRLNDNHVTEQIY